jgi:hypothetical protein
VKAMQGSARHGLQVAVGLGMCSMIVAGGCTGESTRVALDAQRSADQIQQAVFDRQQEALCLLLYRDLLRRLTGAGLELSSVQRETLNEVWNDRDLVQFWAVQNEWAQALRIIGVDLKLFSEQSIVDLLWKGLEARADLARAALATNAAEQFAESASAGSAGVSEPDGK